MTKLCKKIRFQTTKDSNISVILGIIIEESPFEIVVQTRNKVHRLNKTIVLEIVDTDIPFENGKEDYY